MKKPLFLIGYMGCGKTTLGTALATALNCDFIDLDDVIEQREGLTVSEIFKTKGENYFRATERATLNDVARQQAVIATGGGTPCAQGAMELMNGRGTTVWLRPSRERLLSRLTLPEQQAKRPLLAGKTAGEVAQIIDKGLAAREQHYNKAQIIFDSSRLESADEINSTVRKFIALMKRKNIL